MTNKKHGLTYTIADIEGGHASNIDMMASDDPTIAATARLARDLVNTLDQWMSSESDRGTDSMSVMIGAMHGVTTVCGTVLLQVPIAQRPRVAALMRKQALSIFDSMVQIVSKGAA